MATQIDGMDGLKAAAGRHLGYSGWHEVTQEEINLFADATGDHQWIHVDEERAKAGPFGKTIAHGYLTLSLTPAAVHEIISIEGFSMAVNYGLDRVRFPSPVTVGSKVRAGVELTGVQDVDGGVQASFTVTHEIEGGTKPVCVAQVLFRYYV